MLLAPDSDLPSWSGGQPEGEGFWDKAAAESKRRSQPAPTPRRLRKRLLLWIGLAVLLVLVLGVALAPTIASSFVPGVLRDQAARRIAGEVRVSSASLSWLGSQSLRGVELVHDGKTIADVSVELDHGLLGFIAGSRQLGTATLRGKIDLVRYADGSTNLERALRPGAGSGAPGGGSAPAPAEPFRVPDGAAVRVVLDGLAISFRDESAGSGAVEAALRKIDAEASLASGDPITLKLKAEALVRAGSAAPRSGSIDLDARLDKWMGSDGALTPERLVVRTTLAIKDLPTALVDALLGRAGALVAGLGERLHLDLSLDGSLKTGQGTLRARAGSPGADPALAADLSIALAEDVLTLQSPAAVSLKGSALRALAEGIDRALAGQDALVLDALPDVRVNVSELRAHLPRPGSPVDLRQARLELEAATSEVGGRVRLDDRSAPRTLALAPLSLRLSAPDLAGPVRLTLSTRASVADESGSLASAGTIDADFTFKGLLDAGGAPIAGIPASIEGRAAVKGIASALAQPLVAGLGIDLPREIGPTLDLTLAATTSAATGTDLPPVDVTLSIAAEHVDAEASLALRPDRIETRGQGVRLSLRRAGAMLDGLLDDSLGVALEPGGSASLALTGAVIPLSPAGAPLLDQAEARAEATIASLNLRASAVEGAPIRLGSPLALTSFRADAVLARGRDPSLRLSAAASHTGREFSIEGQAEIAGLIRPTPAGREPPPLDVSAASPAGSLVIRDLPTSLVRSLAALAPDGASASESYRAGSGLDLGRLVADVLGPALSVTLTGQRSGERLALEARVESAGLSTQVKGRADDRVIALERSRTRLALTPDVAGRLLATFAEASSPAPTLAGATGAIIDVDAVTIPRAALDDPALLPALSVALGFDRHLLVKDLVVARGAERRTIAPVGLANFSLRADLPLGALSGGGTLKGLLSGDAVVTDQARRLASFHGEWSMPIGPGPTLAGPFSARLNLVRLDAAEMDTLLASAGLAGQADPRLADLLGPSADGSVSLRIDPPAESRPLGEALTLGSASVEASLTSPNLSTPRPLRLALQPDRLTLSEPATLSVTMTPTLLERLLSLPSRTRLDAPLTGTLALQRLSLARPTPQSPDTGPLRPGVFALALSGDLGPLQLTTGAQKATLSSTRLEVSGSDASVALALQVDEVQVQAGADAPPQSSRGLALRVSADGIADEKGHPTPARAVFNARGELPLVPTALLDALAGQNGLLLDALGPTVSVDLRAESLSVEAGTGTLQAEARSDRAVATLRGRMTPGSFVVDQAPAEIRVTRITPDLSRRLTRGLPMLSSLEKTTDMPPAQVLARDLRVPTDGNAAGLSGNVEIDPGVVRFTTSPLFGRILARAHQRTEGAAGERLQPLQLAISAGVIRVTRWEIPLGEFKVYTEGSINLPTSEVDIVTWIPLAALSEEAARAFQTGNLLGGLLGRDKEQDEQRRRQALAPFRSRGRMGDLGPPTPDLKLFAEELARTFKDDLRAAPGRLLEDALKKDRKPPP